MPAAFEGGRRRRRHSDEFKADAVAACAQPGMSMAAVAMAHGINANLLRRWVHEAEMKPSTDTVRADVDDGDKGLDFDSNDHALIKKHLRAMVSTTVEWQSPTSGEGASWNVSGLLAHAKLSKERGQVWVEWSYAVNLKQELLDPTVFARLRLEVISQLRTHAGVVLYEICTRYKDIGRTARQPWRWWYPVLSGNPPSEKSERLEYRIFKRDTLKPAIAEVNAITDLDIELVEHKQGRFVDEIQFHPRGLALALRAALYSLSNTEFALYPGRTADELHGQPPGKRPTTENSPQWAPSA